MITGASEILQKLLLLILLAPAPDFLLLIPLHWNTAIDSILLLIQEPRAGVRPLHVPVGHVRRGADPGRLRAVDVQGLGQPQAAELRRRSADLVLGHPGGVLLGRPRAMDVQGYVKEIAFLRS